MWSRLDPVATIPVAPVLLTVFEARFSRALTYIGDNFPLTSLSPSTSLCRKSLT